MKKFIISGAFIILACTACNNTSTKKEDATTSEHLALDTTKLKSGDVFYQCEMHPEVLSDMPGSCSKCGMDLEKIEKK